MMTTLRNDHGVYTTYQQSRPGTLGISTEEKRGPLNSERLRCYIVGMAKDRGNAANSQQSSVHRHFILDNFDTTRYIRQYAIQHDIHRKSERRGSILSIQKGLITPEIGSKGGEHTSHQPQYCEGYFYGPNEVLCVSLNECWPQTVHNPNSSMEASPKRSVERNQRHDSKQDSNDPIRLLKSASGAIDKRLNQSTDDVESFGPTTHFPSTPSFSPRFKIETVRGLNKAKNGAYFVNDHSCNQRRHADKSPVIEVYTLKGNALPTPPPRQKSARRCGLFSATLDSLKKRLKVTSQKYSHRLQDTEMDNPEVYVIRANINNIRVPSATSGLVPSMPALRPSTQPSSQQFRAQSRMLVTSAAPDHRTLTQKTSYVYPEQNHGQVNDSVTPGYLVTEIRNNDSPLLHRDQEHKNILRAPNKFSYRLPQDGMTTDFEGLHKLPPSVKTYVLEDEEPSKELSKIVLPLTAQNLKLHNSIQANYENRMRHLELQHSPQYQQMAEFRHPNNDINIYLSETYSEERIWKWLREVTTSASAYGYRNHHFV